MIALLHGGVEIAYDDAGSGIPVLFIHGWPHNRTMWAGQLSGLRRLMASAPAKGVIGALRAMADRPDSTALLATITIPTLVVGGTQDTIIPPDELRALAESIPGSRLELLEGCGHLCPLERPAAFNHVMSEFLGTLLYD